MKTLHIIAIAFVIALSGSLALANDPQSQLAEPAKDQTKQIIAARAKALDWLAGQQNADGSWGKQYTIAVTSFTVLSHLAANDEPFDGKLGQSLTKGLKFLLTQQKDGQFNSQGHSWIHGQGFATLALAETYGRCLTCKKQPDLDMKQIKQVIANAVKIIAKHQSHSGGWWYKPGSPNQHEGSTTVCAVQAMVAADNFGIEIDKDVLKKGFEYLKKSQNVDGGFDYMQDNSPNTKSMKEGTAADVATLGLMKKFDYAVMMKGYKFMLRITPAAISKERFPYYGHFYGCMGMRLLGQEFKSFRDKTDGYIHDAIKELLAWQDDQGKWPVKGWMKSKGEKEPYATAFATMTLGIHDGRLSIFNRHKPKLPETQKVKDLSMAAWKMHRDHMKAVVEGGTDKSDIIPFQFWPPEIADLNPLEVYTHRVNVVVVLKSTNETDEGLYVYIPISSYLPRNGDDGFTFKPIGNNMLRFTRKLKK